MFESFEQSGYLALKLGVLLLCRLFHVSLFLSLCGLWGSACHFINVVLSLG
jgi:hypothetical protein